MRFLNFEDYGVQELSAQELRDVNGGCKVKVHNYGHKSVNFRKTKKTGYFSTLIKILSIWK